MATEPSASFDYTSDIPIGYYDDIFRRRHGMQSKWHHLKFQHVRRQMPAQGFHIDVACGPGTFIGTLPFGLQSVGVDISEPQIRYARERYGTRHREFRTMEPGALAFEPSVADVVTSIELIEHITESEARTLLRECHRVLKPGGRLLVTTPNYGAFWPFLEILLNRFGKISYEDQHISRYTKCRLGKLLRDCGFVEIAVETCLWSAPFAAAIHWKLSDLADQLEPKFITRRIGHLLVGSAIKQ